ncbi:hypothetical protein H312_02389 [Anncaliia algerae PRA339]|uniref:Uncharacterized protein n=1 Tax=Anncaliia algerae PRA339 TaxID=1288291 RepID=A0A059EZP3_9MICR|nr:hypothetical protein H312_02389 [Anncaliia algerae PRA339]
MPNILRKFININMRQKIIIDAYAGIFYSESYDFLTNILPYSNLIHCIRNAKGIIFREICIFRYIRLLICRFEQFRYECFNNKNISEYTLQSLYSNPKFNEMVAVVSILFIK